MLESTVCVGIGNDFRRDDGAGLAVARRLRDHIPGLAVVELTGDTAPLLDLFTEYAHVVIVDAAQSGTEPGTLHHFDAAHEPIPAALFTMTTHAFGPAQAVEMARTLGMLPPICHVYGIEGADFSMGDELTPAVEEAVSRLVGTLRSTVIT